MMQPSSSEGRTSIQSTNTTPYGYSTPYGQYHQQGQLYTAANPNTNCNDSTGLSMDGLANAFGEVSIRHMGYNGPIKSNNNAYAANIVNMSAMPGTQSQGQMMYHLAPDGSMVVSSMPTAQGNYQQYPGNYNMATLQAPYLQQPSYPAMPPSGPRNLPNTPRGQGWVSTQQAPQEVPELTAPRRTSWSSNDGSSPQTPLFPGAFSRGYPPSYYSPNPWSTPSPKQTITAYSGPQILKDRNNEYYHADFSAVIKVDPEIPAAIPALWSPEGGRGTLDKILNNTESTTNVYIRGFPPTTTDELIHKYGTRFGNIDSCKAMIDLANGQCKGQRNFGFIKFYNFVDAENCIRVFYFLGYEAKYARPSHNSRLKTLSDPTNNNLYVSNLPMTMTDPDLKAIFTSVYPDIATKGHTVLKDTLGTSRGVGFIRFETPEICQKIINEFHGKQVGEGDNSKTLQIRFADTEDQKKLKTSTAERRQYKASEYSHGVAFRYSPNAAAAFASPLQSRVLGSDGSWASASPVSPDPSMFAYQQMMIREAQATAVGGTRPQISFAPVQARQSSRIKIESPSANAARKMVNHTVAPTGDDADTPTTPTDSSDEKSGSNGISVHLETDLSPAKSKL